jgi:hypothetical protein
MRGAVDSRGAAPGVLNSEGMMATNVDDIDEFFRLSKTTVDVHHLAHALEDMPADAQEQAAQIFSTPVGITCRQRVFDILEKHGCRHLRSP